MPSLEFSFYISVAGKKYLPDTKYNCTSKVGVGEVPDSFESKREIKNDVSTQAPYQPIPQDIMRFTSYNRFSRRNWKHLVNLERMRSWTIE